MEGVLSADYRHIGDGPCRLEFLNSGRDTKTLYVKVGRKPVRVIRMSAFTGCYFRVEVGKVMARQTGGKTITFESVPE